jgi:hypothetical protein
MGDFPQIHRQCTKNQRGRRTGGAGVAGGCRSWRSPRSPPRWTATSPPACKRGRWMGETPVHGLRSWSSPSRRRLKPEPLAGVALHHGAGTGPAKGNAAPVCIFTAPSSSSSTPPRRNAKERGCSTGKMSPWKPWTAPPCFLCSRLFHAARHHLLAAVSRARGEH